MFVFIKLMNYEHTWILNMLMVCRDVIVTGTVCGHWYDMNELLPFQNTKNVSFEISSD